MTQLKKCSCCEILKEINQFGSHKGKNGNKDGLQPHCNPCKYAKAKQWRDKNKNNLKYRLDRRMHKNISKRLNAFKGGRSWKRLVGYTTRDLISHLEKQFRDGMTWENYGTVWHIDHIIPKSFFKYENYEDEMFKKCWSLENLQPLFAKENLSKNNKVPNPFLLCKQF